MNFSLKKLEAYCQEFSSSPPEYLNELERKTHLRVLSPQMIAGPIQGSLLFMIAALMKPSRVLEIGAFTGYSSLCLARGLRDEGKVLSIEVNEELEYLANEAIRKAGFSDRIEYIVGDARQIIPSLTEPFDLVYIDAGKMHNSYYYNIVFDLVKSGGCILVDNVLWSGKVVLKEQDNDTRMIHDFNVKIRNDERVENLILPVRDGLMIILKK
jgi:predicted O-methyltransferase YrrM